MGNSFYALFRKKNLLPLMISAFIMVAIVAGYFLFPQMERGVNEAWNILTSEDNEKIRRWVDQFGIYGPAVIICTMIIQTFLLVIPSVALIVVAILAYGPWWGSALALIAVTVASTIGYFCGRYLGELFVVQMIGEKTEKKTSDFIHDYGFWAVFLVRFNSLLSNDAISFVSGILGMRLTTFLAATVSGISPLILLIALFSHSMDNLKTGLIWVSILSLILFGLYIWWDKTR